MDLHSWRGIAYETERRLSAVSYPTLGRGSFDKTLRTQLINIG